MTSGRVGASKCSRAATIRTGESWLKEESAIQNRKTLACRGDDRVCLLARHPVISFREAVERGVLDVPEGCVLIAHDSLLRTLARRIA